MGSVITETLARELHETQRICDALAQDLEAAEEEIARLRAELDAAYELGNQGQGAMSLLSVTHGAELLKCAAQANYQLIGCGCDGQMTFRIPPLEEWRDYILAIIEGIDKAVPFEADGRWDYVRRDLARKIILSANGGGHDGNDSDAH
ncbi:hypothetical protein GF348_24555 [candidate division KSB3 bacterium]|nr:hypothetical protein [candidate division KSB3 bacterium]